MGDRDTGGSAPTAPLSSDHRATRDTTQHSHFSHPILENSASEASPLTGIHHHAPVTGPIVYGTASPAPFLAVSPGSENRHDGYVPGSKPYNPQPSYNPSYMTDKPITPRPNVYGKKTIVLKRTDAEISSQKTKQLIALCVALVIGTIIPFGIYFYYISDLRDSSSKTVKNYGHEPNNNLDTNPTTQDDSRVFTTTRPTTADPYLTDKPKNEYDDTYWSNKFSVMQNYPFLDDKYEDTVTKNPWKLKTREEILREIAILSNPYEDAMKALQGLDVKFDDLDIEPDTMDSEKKDEIKKKKHLIQK